MGLKINIRRCGLIIMSNHTEPEAESAVKFAIRNYPGYAKSNLIFLATHRLFHRNSAINQNFTITIEEHLKRIITDQFNIMILNGIVYKKDGNWLVKKNKNYPTLREGYQT